MENKEIAQVLYTIVKRMLLIFCIMFGIGIICFSGVCFYFIYTYKSLIEGMEIETTTETIEMNTDGDVHNFANDNSNINLGVNDVDKR